MTPLGTGEHGLRLVTVSPGRYDAVCACGNWRMLNVTRPYASITHGSHVDEVCLIAEARAEVDAELGGRACAFPRAGGGNAR